MKMLKHRTPHQRACACAALFVLLLTGLSVLTKRLLPDAPSAVRMLLTSVLPLIGIIALYTRQRRLSVRAFYRLNAIPAHSTVFWLIFGIGANCFATLLNLPAALLLSKTNVPAAGVSAVNFGAFLSGIVFTAFLPAVLEELFCRGILLREYENYGTRTAVLATASVFSLLHLSATSFVFTFVLGSILALVVLKTDSLYPAMLVHFSANLYSLLRSFLGNLIPPAYKTVWAFGQFATLVLLALGFAFALYHLLRIRGKTPFTKKSPAARFGFSLGLVLLLAVYLLYHLRYWLS